MRTIFWFKGSPKSSWKSGSLTTLKGILFPFFPPTFSFYGDPSKVKLLIIVNSDKILIFLPWSLKLPIDCI